MMTHEQWLAMVQGNRWIVEVQGYRVGRLFRSAREACAYAAGLGSTAAAVIEVDREGNPVGSDDGG